MKKLAICAISGTLALTGLVIAGGGSKNSPLETLGENANLEISGDLISSSTTEKIFEVSTNLGNKIRLAHSSTSNGKILKEHGYIYNVDAITGLKSITVAFEGELKLTTWYDDILNGQSVNLINNETSKLSGSDCAWFRIEALKETRIDSIKVEYTCDAKDGSFAYTSFDDLGNLDREGAKNKNVTVSLGERNFEQFEYAYDGVEANKYNQKAFVLGNTKLNKYNASVPNVGEYKFTFLNGIIKGGADVKNPDNTNNSHVFMLLPNHSDVVFENVIFDSTVSFHNEFYTNTWAYLNSLTFKNCTFNGGIFDFPAKELTITDCTFNKYINDNGQNDSNPIWVRSGAGQKGEVSLNKVTFTNNTVNAYRPVKFERLGINNNHFELTFLDNTFNMSTFNDTDLKNYGIYLDSGVTYHSFTLIDDGNVINGGNGDKVYAFNGVVDGNFPTKMGTKILDRNGNEKVIVGGKWKSIEEAKLCSSIDEVATDTNINVSSSGTAIDAIKSSFTGDNATKQSTTISLPSGNFSLKDETDRPSLKDKTVVFIGSGVNSTTYLANKSATGTEKGSDYSFDGAKLVVFKDMKISLGTANYNGFVRPQNLVFDNCLIEGMGHYWGDKTTFNNCKFSLSGADYNIYLYSGVDFTFKNCEFNSPTNRFMNAYREETSTEPIKVNITNCKFIGAEDTASAPNAKPVVNIKKYINPIWQITIKNSSLEGALNKEKGFYQAEEGSKGFVSIDGNVVWEAE